MEKRLCSGSPWEDTVGYARAVRVGRRVEVAGTTAFADDRIVGIGDAYTQTVQCLRTIERALLEAGSALEHVVRTRMFVTDISQWEEIARAHRECFGAIRPVTTMVEVRALIAPDLLVEIEAEAEIPEEGDRG